NEEVAYIKILVSACKRNRELDSIEASRDIRDIRISIVDIEEAVIHRVVKDKKVQ
ncbi:3849_t:CDS:1, partial [Scutellospora calospora]